MAVNLRENNIKPHQNFTCYKKHGGSGLTSWHRTSKVKKKKNCGKNLSEQLNVKFKN